jgi:hypothetical protein
MPMVRGCWPMFCVCVCGSDGVPAFCGAEQRYYWHWINLR